MQSREPTTAQMNEIIAIFMGGKLISDCSIIDDDLKRKYWKFKDRIEAADMLKYHKSWDALIPVCKKIKSIKISGMPALMEQMKATQEMNNGLVSLDIEKTHKGVYLFIIWHNNQNETNE